MSSNALVTEELNVTNKRSALSESVGFFITLTIALFMNAFVLLATNTYTDRKSVASYAIPIVIGLICIVVSVCNVNSTVLSSGLLFGSITLIAQSLIFDWKRIPDEQKIVILGSTLTLASYVAYSKLP